ncbi:MAG TPA: UbiA family prenyltransferase [Planctomycetota bacterium]|nr:UbiA family prenyltransferase [Planctomycetota bacterium]
MTIADYLKLTRFPLVFTAMADSAVGAALVGVNLLTCARAIPAVAASAFLYAGGMVMNDLCDRERDRTLHPERPIPSGRVSTREATWFTLILFIAALGVSMIAGLQAGIGAIVIVALICLYNRLLKHSAVTGSLGMAAVRGANMAMGALAVGALPVSPEFPWIPIAVLSAYVFALTMWSTREDQAGSRGYLAVIGAAMAWIPLASALKPAPWRWTALLPSLWIAPWVVRALVRPERGRLMQVIRWGVLGIIVLDASFLAALGRWTEAGVVAGLLIPALLLLPVFRKL